MPGMPSRIHELLVEMFHDRPALAAELLSNAVGIEISLYAEARLSTSVLTDVAPTEYRADAVVSLDLNDLPMFAIVVEVQLRPDPHKRRTWPVYVTTLHARLGCPVALLAICPNQQVARYCSAPIAIGPPGSRLTPIALGPSHIPTVTDLRTARENPELTVLSALSQGNNPDPTLAFTAFFTALDTFDRDRADLYYDLVLAVLPEAARKRLEDLVITSPREYQSDFARRYYGQGKAEGEANALLKILDRRGIEVSDDIRTRITECTDLAQLDRWIDEAATAEKIDDIGF
jgi:hypothetical protein